MVTIDPADDTTLACLPCCGQCHALALHHRDGQQAHHPPADARRLASRHHGVHILRVSRGDVIFGNMVTNSCHWPMTCAAGSGTAAAIATRAAARCQAPGPRLQCSEAALRHRHRHSITTPATAAAPAPCLVALWCLLAGQVLGGHPHRNALLLQQLQDVLQWE